MGVEENKALFLRFYELLNLGEFDKLFELFDPGYISHYTTRDSSLEENKQSWPMLHTAFPDITYTVEHIVAEGDKVAYQETVTGTHQGEFLGIPPTGKKIETINTCIMKITGGKFAECWATLDELRLMQQLGVIPSQ